MNGKYCPLSRPAEMAGSADGSKTAGASLPPPRIRASAGRRMRGSAGTLAATLGLALLFALPLAAQSGRLRLNLDHLAKRAVKSNSITLSGSMLRSMIGNSAMGHSGNPQADAVLAHLKGIYIRELKFAKPGEYSQRDLHLIMAQLAAPGWQTIVRHSSADEQAWIAVQRNDEGVITALAILDAKPTKLSVVNIVGPLPQGLASLGALGSLGNLGKAMGGAAHHDPQHPKLEKRPPAAAAAGGGTTHGQPI